MTEVQKYKLPIGWGTIELIELMAKTQSVNPNKTRNSEYELWSVPAFPTDNPEYVHGEEIGSNKQLVKPGDVLLCKINPRINRVWLVREKTTAEQIASTEWIVLRFDGLLPKFIMYQLREEGFRSRLCTDLSGVGGSLTRARPRIVGTRKINIAPVNEQKRIVAKIEELQSRSRKAREALETIPDLLEQLRQSILAAAFRGDLTKKWREQHKGRIEPAAELLKRIRIERRKRWEAAELDKLKAKGLTGDQLDTQFAKRRKQYQEPAPVDTTDLPKLPEGWCWARTDEISEGALGKMLDKQKHTKGIKLPYLRNVNVRWGAVDISDLLLMYFKDYEIDRYSIKRGDIIVCEGGEPGRATVWENVDFVLYQKALHRVRPFKGIDPWIMVFQLWHDSKLGILEKYFTGTTIKHFTGRSLQQYPVSLPPVIEQKRIVEKIKATFNQIEKLYEKVDELQNQYSSIESTIISKAFRGELVPQDPNDEPASILLERIRQEKEQKPRSKRIPDK